MAEPAGTFQLGVSGALRVVPISQHIRMCEVADWVKGDRILRPLRLVDESLKRWGIRASCIAVTELNPHARTPREAGRDSHRRLVE
jgi:4-phospho-D-threonate 3-dehydrogenase / 4-phospho-D-erythronate 3-dehydrogenase